ncbi:MAG: hypothetical protein HPY54_13535 [Chthonomonadetes bacterium]|nr:hypothetical protein [Chthonomonadetes bacterium]
MWHSNQRIWLIGLVALVVVGIGVAIWSFRRPSAMHATEAEQRRHTALQQQVDTLRGNPNIPPQVKQWLEYNARQQSNNQQYGR